MNDECAFTAADLQREGENRRAAMRRGPQPDNVRRMRDGTIVRVMRAVMESDVDGHGNDF